MIKVNEIFYSIQGEGTKSGYPCIFIRLTYCNLRCSYCDTEYSFYEGREMKIEHILGEIKKYNCNLVEITGGEPLIQPECLELLTKLCDKNYNVMIETGGSLSIREIDGRVKIIMDLKCPSSNMSSKNNYENLNFIKTGDELKFVIGDREDFDWSKKIIKEYNLQGKCNILFSPVFGKLENRHLAEWILNDNLEVRFQTQLHKYIWEPDKRGV